MCINNILVSYLANVSINLEQCIRYSVTIFTFKEFIINMFLLQHYLSFAVVDVDTPELNLFKFYCLFLIIYGQSVVNKTKTKKTNL